MPRDEEGRRRAKKQARIALILCVAMLGALTPVVAALNKATLDVAVAQPCGIVPDPTEEVCPSPTPSSSASASRSASSTATATATATASSGTTPSAGTTTSSPTPSRTPTPVSSPSRSPQTFNSATDVTIKLNKRKAKFSGRLNSDFDECEAGRSVKLFYVVPGFGTTRAAGKTTSTPSGTWKIDKKKAKKGEYYATAKARRVTTTTGDTINCKKGKSKRVNA